MATLNVFEIQPNSDKRNEFLVVLDYLLHHTCDEKHATSQTKIIEYAKSEYGLDIRRDRIPQILLHLSQLTEKYPDKFPFKLKTVIPNSATNSKDGARRKYYISERAFSDNEILKIISAIKSDKTISTDATDKLINKFLLENASENRKESLLKKLNSKQRKISKVTNRGMDYLEKIEKMADDHETIWFSIKDFREVDFDVSRFLMRRKMENETEHCGYVYQWIEINNKYKLVIYLRDYKHAMITPTTNVVINRHMNLKDLTGLPDYSLDNNKFSSIDEWVEKHYQGQDGLIEKFVFKFTLSDTFQKDIEYIETTFRKHWGKTLEYEICDREVEIETFNENDEPIKETIIVKDAYVTIETTRESFLHWYKDYKIISSVVIVSPAHLNDLVLAPLVNRFVKRINKYGARYDYELRREVKPEYQEFLKKRNDLFQERRRLREVITEGNRTDTKPESADK